MPGSSPSQAKRTPQMPQNIKAQLYGTALGIGAAYAIALLVGWFAR